MKRSVALLVTMLLAAVYVIAAVVVLVIDIKIYHTWGWPPRMILLQSFSFGVFGLIMFWSVANVLRTSKR